MVFAAMVSVGVGLYLQYMFGEEILERSPLVFYLMSVWFVSYVIILIFINTWDTKTLTKMARQSSDNCYQHEDTTRGRVGYTEKNIHENETVNAYVSILDQSFQFDDSSYETEVSTPASNQIEFQMTDNTRSESKHAEKIDPEFIKRRLLEKETRIMKIVDINIVENAGHMYDFSATLYVSAKSLAVAADIVDSANTILEGEFNIKETRLLPVISR